MYLVYLVLIHQVAGADAAAVLQLAGNAVLGGSELGPCSLGGDAIAVGRQLHGIDGQMVTGLVP